MKVKVTRKSGDVATVEAEEGDTVRKVLESAQEDVPEDHKVFLDGREVDLEDEGALVQDQSVVVVQPEVAGGQS